MKAPLYLTLLLLISAIGCNSNTTGNIHFDYVVKKVDVSKMHAASLDSDVFEPLIVFATYPAKKINAQNSNLYKCIFGRKHDTVFVFETDRKVNWSVLKEIDKEDNGIILNDSIQKNPPKITLVFVPQKLKIPDTAKFIFASPNAIEE